MSGVVIEVFHAKWLICGVCWLCCSLWVIIVADYKDTYTVIIRTLTCWNNYPYHILGSSSPRNLSINFALHARRVKILFTMKQNPEIMNHCYCFHFPVLEFI